jgi:RNA polymerase sigma factor (sigma-70 family)
MIRQSAPNTNSADVALGGVWREHHRYVLNVAYRMLGSVSEAEDIVQDAFARLLRVDLAEIEDVRGWLVVAVTRRCLDELRSARSRREVYVGPWMPEPVIQPSGQDQDPADRVTLDDSVRMAMLLVLERLSPAERAAFVLHDVFQFSFEDVAKIVERTPAACRQLASRARRHVRAEASPARFHVDPADLSRVADRFIAAASSGDLNALMQCSIRTSSATPTRAASSRLRFERRWGGATLRSDCWASFGDLGSHSYRYRSTVSPVCWPTRTTASWPSSPCPSAMDASIISTRLPTPTSWRTPPRCSVRRQSRHRRRRRYQARNLPVDRPRRHDWCAAHAVIPASSTDARAVRSGCSRTGPSTSSSRRLFG